MNNSRRFIIKVEARDCPDEVDRPNDAGDWEGKAFNTGPPQASSGKKRFPEDQRRNPEPDDHLLIWVNKLGLTAIAEVGVSPNVGRTVAVRSVELRPRPRLNDSDLKLSKIAALRDLASNRPGKLRFVTHEGWNAILKAAAAKISNAKTPTNSADAATTTAPEPGEAVGTSLGDIDDERSQSEDKAGVVIASSNGLNTEDDALRQEISRLRLVEAMKLDAARAGMDRTGVYPPRAVPNDLDVVQMLVQKWHDQIGLCALCDKPIPWNPTNKLLQLSRDRADSANKTYDYQNTQLTHLACNLGKSDATAHEWGDYLAMVRQPLPR
jgi:hypothetical protein